jgi:membrane protein implicated in regulation of membrane protease activity
VDVDVDADVDVDVDADVDADVDGHAEVDAAGAGGLAEVWLPFISLRFWVFFLAFFGITGTVLSLFALSGKWTTLAASLVMGCVVGFTAAFVIQRLKKQVLGVVADERSYKGTEGTVLLPISAGSDGKVRLTIQGQTVDLPARTDAKEQLSVGSSVLVIDYTDNRLVVIPASELEATDKDDNVDNIDNKDTEAS